SRSILALVLAEASALLVLGALAGLALSAVVVGIVRAKLGSSIPLNPVGAEIWLRGLALAVLVGLIVGALPALRGMRLRIVDALAGR
ncbi:MAG: ABC transporter permease, partial [Gammaproteobacteria bacterium]|nr:ABC transporter permease [Gammaproteobacteria bacterium]